VGSVGATTLSPLRRALANRAVYVWSAASTVYASILYVPSCKSVSDSEREIVTVKLPIDETGVMVVPPRYTKPRLNESRTSVPPTTPADEKCTVTLICVWPCSSSSAFIPIDSGAPCATAGGGGAAVEGTGAADSARTTTAFVVQFNVRVTGSTIVTVSM
jgi:hypothetical protein